MPLYPYVKQEVLKNLQTYEGRIKHLYLDSVGKVTVGVGHLVSAKVGMAALPMYKVEHMAKVSLPASKTSNPNMNWWSVNQ